MRTTITTITVIAAMLLTVSCGTKKSITESTATTGLSKADKSEQAAFMQRIAESGVTANNIVASADFRLVAGGKDLSCDGKVSMRRDKAIRLQLLLPIIRTEIARVDFTPDYVLLVDRFHKEYIKASYKDIDFLAANGLSFYSLQALFWNQMFMPGEKNLSESALKHLTCQIATTGTEVPVTYKSGNLAYQWTADRATALIKTANVAYESTQHNNSALHWTYSDFRQVGGKAFPCTQQLDVTTEASGKTQTAQLNIKMSSPKTSSDWDTTTELSAKYKRIEAQDILKKLLSIQ